MDLADRAQDNDFNEAALEAALEARESRLQRHSGPSAYRCDECGDAIPEARRQAAPGTEHCTECADFLDQLSKRVMR